MNNYEKTNLIVQISKMYYEHNIGQREIAERLNISRSYVSKLLIESRTLGIVRIEINDPLETESTIEQSIRTKYRLNKAIVVPIRAAEYDMTLERIAAALSRYLFATVQSGDIIGVAWGKTLQMVANKLMRKDCSGGIITQLYGGFPTVNREASVQEIILKFARAFNFKPHFMLLPAIVDSPEIKEAIEQDKGVARALELAEQSQIAIFSVGRFGVKSSLVEAGYFTEEQVEKLHRRGVVGDVCARLFDSSGNIVDSNFDDRSIGIPLHHLREKKHSILVSGGKEKILPIHGALTGGYANVLVTDEHTAQGLLHI
ncbi:MAG: sugar-binding transcriptional regulator [Ethanoligenens sp.]|uniref:sugar-binding transcriptional regulator n=1 Tax=Ethanoligenens sp. TaxID=2099655 RepID=UPI0039E801D8